MFKKRFNLNYSIQTLLIFLLFFAISACKQKNNRGLKNKLVLIFENAPDQNRFTFKSGVNSSILPLELISYIDSCGNRIDYTPSQQIDTLSISNSQQEYLEVMHKFNGIERIYYQFKLGDTIKFTYEKDKYPIAYSLTENIYTKFYNFQKKVKDRRCRFNLESYSLLRSDFIRMLNRVKREEPKVYHTVFKKHHNDCVDLDSLSKAFNSYLINYQLSLKSFSSKDSIAAHYFHYYSYLLKYKINSISIFDHYFSDEKQIQKLEKSLTNFIDDRFVNYVSYREFLNIYLNLFLPSTGKFPSIKGSNGKYYDYRVLYDYLKEKNDIPVKTKDLLLFYCLDKIINNFSKDNIQEYLNKYKQDIQNEDRLHYLIDKYHLDFTSSKDLLVIDSLGSERNLQQILDRNKGKLIYIDFWASWCAPCVRSLSKSEQLREEYKNAPISFVYLSEDDSKEVWLKASKKYALANCKENYLILNSKVSEFMEQLTIRSIPRYLLFDSKGKLIHSHAPGPASKEIRLLLDKELNLLIR